MGKVVALPAVVVAFVEGARRPAALLVVGNRNGDRPAWRSNEHVGLHGILRSEVVSAMDAPLGGLKSLACSVGMNGAAAIFDGDGALSHDVVYESRMVVPGARDLAHRCFEGSGGQCGR